MSNSHSATKFVVTENHRPYGDGKTETQDQTHCRKLTVSWQIRSNWLWKIFLHDETLAPIQKAVKSNVAVPDLSLTPAHCVADS